MNAGRKLRSRAWFDDPSNPDMTALYLERYLNFGLTLHELQSGQPIIGIAQTGSDLSPCNRHHLVLAERVRDGIRAAGGIPLQFPVHPIQETGKRPTAALDRNLAYLGLVEVLFGYPLDGVVLTIGCDKTTPACLMAAATVNIPAIAFSVGPMSSAWHQGKRIGSGVVIWQARQELATGKISYEEFIRLVASAAPSTGYCNTMGTATTLSSLTEVLGMALPDSATIPATHRDRLECAYHTGRQIVEMVAADRKPSDILTRESFLNAIRVNSAIGGSTNAPVHLIALARHIGVELQLDDWEKHGQDIPLLVNLQPAGDYLAEDYYNAGGVGAVIGELLRHELIHGSATTVDGRSIAEIYAGARIKDEDVIRPFAAPLMAAAGLTVLRGNLFETAIMKTSVISPEFRARYLSAQDDPEAFVATAVVFDGPEDYHARIDDPTLAIGERSILVIRGVGPLGYPGSGEVVNMRPPCYLIEAGIHSLPCMGDGRQSGTSGSPSILNATPEAAAGGGLAILRTGDRIRIDLRKREVNLLVGSDEIRERRQALEAAGGYRSPASQTPWQAIHRATVGQLETGGVIEHAVEFQRLAQTIGVPRHNH